MSSFQYKRILIKCPESVISAYNPPVTVLEGTVPNQFLRLYVEPGDYQLTNNQENETRYNNGFSSVTLSPALMRRTLRLKIKDDRVLLRAIVEELAALSYTSTYQQHVPIELHDYCRPEREDIKAAIATSTEAFTVRHGMIDPAKIESGGAFTFVNQDRVLEGWTFEFAELKLRAS
jgi:hypothetical protein